MRENRIQCLFFVLLLATGGNALFGAGFVWNAELEYLWRVKIVRTVKLIEDCFPLYTSSLIEVCAGN